MKKLFVVLVAVAFCFAAISCKRECKCVGTYEAKKDGVVVEEGKIDHIAGQMTQSDCKKFEYIPYFEDPGVTVTMYITCTSE